MPCIYVVPESHASALLEYRRFAPPYLRPLTHAQWRKILAPKTRSDV